MDIKIIRSKRKTLAIEIAPGKGVVVRVPLRVNDAVIQKLLQQKRAWIQKHLAEALQKQPARSYIAGEWFWYLGIQYQLEIGAEYFRGLRFSGERFLISKYFRHRAKNLFDAWYKKQAREYITARIEFWANIMRVHYRSVRITSARTRWGSCSNQGTINFSSKLVAAPPEVVDYVVIHELVHLKHHHHRKSFWVEVEKHCPEWGNAKQWLVKNGASIHM